MTHGVKRPRLVIFELSIRRPTEGVNETGSHKQCSHQRRGKTENIGVENHEERIHQVEGEIVAHIAKRVANHVANIEIASIHRLSLLAFRCDGRH